MYCIRNCGEIHVVFLKAICGTDAGSRWASLAASGPQEILPSQELDRDRFVSTKGGIRFGANRCCSYGHFDARRTREGSLGKAERSEAARTCDGHREWPNPPRGNVAVKGSPKETTALRESNNSSDVPSALVAWTADMRHGFCCGEGSVRAYIRASHRNGPPYVRIREEQLEKKSWVEVVSYAGQLYAFRHPCRGIWVRTAGAGRDVHQAGRIPTLESSRLPPRGSTVTTTRMVADDRRRHIMTVRMIRQPPHEQEDTHEPQAAAEPATLITKGSDMRLTPMHCMYQKTDVDNHEEVEGMDGVRSLR
ncbi:hypothetical protein BV25DRAFT_1840064 [Artomyces pyxidatus]|uniref:Uncharacterized protein n=1 Tax=Artomyces pyxidatus TaxID=48021 RepID=A0ACB8SUJ4_9AGAM|nr:hypothetical protein BV25DRAFT_1840064 [Artomyces pyxidatus]